MQLCFTTDPFGERGGSNGFDNVLAYFLHARCRWLHVQTKGLHAVWLWWAGGRTVGVGVRGVMVTVYFYGFVQFPFASSRRKTNPCVECTEELINKSWPTSCQCSESTETIHLSHPCFMVTINLAKACHLIGQLLDFFCVDHGCVTPLYPRQADRRDKDQTRCRF